MFDGVLCKVFHKREIKVKDIISKIFNFCVKVFLIFGSVIVVLWLVYLTQMFYLDAGLGYLSSISFAVMYILIIIPLSFWMSIITAIVCVEILYGVIAYGRKCMNFTVAVCPRYAKEQNKNN